MKQDIEQLIVRMLSGEAGVEDMIRFSDWLSADEQNKEIFIKIQKYWDAKVSHVRMDDSVQSYNRILEKMDGVTPPALSSRRRIKPWALTLAAMFTGLIVFWAIFHNNESTKEYAYISGASVSEVTLPDGTKVSLNKNSTLCFSNQYGDKNRAVHLTGEALFTVMSDRKKPFVVHAGNTRVTALGTIFSVKDYPEDACVSTTLIEGSIRFETPSQQILLQPDQQLVYHKQNEKVDVESVETDLVIAWKDRLIKYRSITFNELTRRLEHIYDVKISITDQRIGEQVISGSFESHLRIEQIFDLLQRYLTFKWKSEEEVYTIYK